MSRLRGCTRTALESPSTENGPGEIKCLQCQVLKYGLTDSDLAIVLGRYSGPGSSSVCVISSKFAKLSISPSSPRQKSTALEAQVQQPRKCHPTNTGRSCHSGGKMRSNPSPCHFTAHLRASRRIVGQECTMPMASAQVDIVAPEPENQPFYP